MNYEKLSPILGSSTTAQRRALMLAARRHGLSVEQVRDLAACRLHQLSARTASELIARLTGKDLPHPPGAAPKKRAYRGAPRGVRIITDDHVQQIHRLMMEYFYSDELRAAAWLEKTFKVTDPQKLATARRAGQAIRTLRTMLARSEGKMANSE